MLETTELAKKIRSAMDDFGITSSDLAREMGVSPQVVYQWRKTGRIAKGRLQQLAVVLRRPIAYFLEDDYQESGYGSMTVAELSKEAGLSPDEIYAAVMAVSSSKQRRQQPPARTAVKRGLKKAG